MRRMIYLDHAATTRPYPEVVEAMLPFYKLYYGNASSGYELGADSKDAIWEARVKVAKTMRVRPETIYFTSGGTEGNNWVLRKITQRYPSGGCHVITSSIEHPAILKTCEDLESQGVQVTRLSVDHNGIVNLKELQQSVRKNTVLISVMYANNEIGTIEPIWEIGQCRWIRHR